MTVVQGVLLAVVDRGVHLPRHRHVQARVVLRWVSSGRSSPSWWRSGSTWRYLGSYMAAVFDGRVHFLGWVERPVYRLLDTGPEHEQTWKRYAGSIVIFSAISIGFTYLIMRIQGSLPLNPQHLGAVVAGPVASTPRPRSSPTPTGRTTAARRPCRTSRQIGALTVQQFVTPAVGIAVAIALVRGFSRRNSPTIGNFWVDITRCILYILLPIAFVAGIIFVGQGAVQTLAGPIQRPRHA